MLICCVKRGDKYDDRYVRRLQAGVRRHLPPGGGAHEFVVFTDKAVDGVLSEKLPNDLPGWWSKLGLFQLREPLVYFDLDVIITGNLGPLLEWNGFGIIKDWWLPGFNSSVMKLTGEEGHVHDRFTPEEMYRGHLGDQGWITKQMSDARTFPPGWFPSYKADKCQESVPDGALACIFHGLPKPCQIKTGWVPELWR